MIFAGAVWFALCTWVVAVNFGLLFGESGSEETLSWPFMALFLLSFWVLGLVLVAYPLVWGLFGMETLIATREFLTHKRTIFANLFNRTYLTDHIANFTADVSVSEGSPLREASRFEQFAVGRRRLSFDYGSRTIRLGAGLDPAEARSILELLKKRMPSVFKDEPTG